MKLLQDELINALKKAAGGHYPTTIRRMQPLLDELGWSLPQLTQVAEDLDSQGIIHAEFASNKLKAIALSADFPNLI